MKSSAKKDREYKKLIRTHKYQFKHAIRNIEKRVKLNNIPVASLKRPDIVSGYFMFYGIIDKPIPKQEVFYFVIKQCIKGDTNLTGAIPKMPKVNKPTKPPKPQKERRLVSLKDRPLHPFYDSSEWIELRKVVLRVYGRKCMKCKATKQIHVDHIKPISKFPHLKLCFGNLQVLCKDCNMEKSNLNQNDYRTIKYDNIPPHIKL